MDKPVDPELLDFIISSYRDGVGDKADQETLDETVEQLYAALRDREWSRVRDIVTQHADKYDTSFPDIITYLDALDDDDFIKESGDSFEDKEISKGAELAIMQRLDQMTSDEMLIKIDEPVGITSLFEMSEKAYNNKGKQAFFISDQVQLDGRISVEISENSTKFEVLKVYKNRDGSPDFVHFGQAAPKHQEAVDVHTESFFVYKFVSDNRQFLLFSDEKLDPQRCTVHGTMYKVSDAKQLGENRKLPINQDIVFVHSVEPLIEAMSEDKFKEVAPRVDHDYLASHLFGQLRHPEWFERLMIANMMVGEDFGYPSPMIWFGEGGTGKSMALEAINTSMGEPNSIHTGSGGTIKGLIPSFKDSPPDEGYLLGTQRVACVDEIFNIFASEIRSSGGNIQDAFRPLLDLIEHKSRTFESGNGSIRGKMEAQMIAATNPSYGIESMVDAAKKMDKAFLSRFILYDQTEAHVDYVDSHKSKVKQAKADGEDILPKEDPEFIGLMDMLRNEVRIRVDFDRISDIHDELIDRVPSQMLRVYKARYDDHMANIAAGIAKYRSIIDDRGDFVITDEDYDEMKTLFEMIVGSWHQEGMVHSLSPRAKINYLKHNERRLYEFISDNPGCRLKEVMDYFDDFDPAYAIKQLNDYDLVEAVDDVNGEKEYYPFWYGDDDEIGEGNE